MITFLFMLKGYFVLVFKFNVTISTNPKTIPNFSLKIKVLV